MALNQREKTIAIAVGAVIAVYGVYAYIAKPYWIDEHERVEKSIKKQQDSLTTQKALVAKLPAIEAQWADLQSKGLQSDAAMMAQKISTSLYAYASSHRVNLESMNSKGQTQKGDFEEYRFVAKASGRTIGIWQYIYDVETSGLPVRIDDVNIHSTKDGTDDLGIEMNITTLVYSPKAARGGRGSATRGSGTRPTTNRGPVTTAAATESSVVDDPNDIIARLKAKRALEEARATQPALTQQAPGGPGADASNNDSPEDIIAKLKAKRAMEDAKATQPATIQNTPGGAK